MTKFIHEDIIISIKTITISRFIYLKYENIRNSNFLLSDSLFFKGKTSFRVYNINPNILVNTLSLNGIKIIPNGAKTIFYFRFWRKHVGVAFFLYASAPKNINPKGADSLNQKELPYCNEIIASTLFLNGTLLSFSHSRTVFGQTPISSANSRWVAASVLRIFLILSP